MATAERITILCDGDRCLDGSLCSDIRHHVTVNDLQRDHALQMFYEEGKRAVIAMRDMFTPALEKVAKELSEFFIMIDDVLKKTTSIPVKWYNPTNRHNFRKMHRITQRRVVKRRDRQSRGSVKLLKVECVTDEEE